MNLNAAEGHACIAETLMRFEHATGLWDGAAARVLDIARPRRVLVRLHPLLRNPR